MNEQRQRVWHAPGPTDGAEGTVAEQLRADAPGFLLRTAVEHGPVAQLPVDGPPTFLLSDPDLIAHALQGNRRNYVQSPRTETFKALLGNGLLTNDGESWLAQRRLIQPAFHHRRLAVLAETIAGVVTHRLATWADDVEQGRPIDVHAAMDDIARRVIVNAMFGMDLADEEYATVKAALEEVSAYLDGKLWEKSGEVADEAERRFAEAVSALDDVVYRMIDTRRVHGGGDDLLTMLLEARDTDTGEGMSDRQLRDEVLTIFRSGHETVALLATWAWHLLDTHPHVQDQVRAEVAEVLGDRTPTAADLPRLTVIRQVIDETLRLYPPAWMISRTVVSDDVLAGHLVPAGSTVLLSPYVMHHHPDHWSDPQAFRPERHADGAPKPQRFTYFPFGGGQRMCIGFNLALMEVTMVVAMVVQRYRLETVGAPDTTPTVRVLLRPTEPITMTPRPTSVELPEAPATVWLDRPDTRTPPAGAGGARAEPERC